MTTPPPVRSGYERQWYRCQRCQHTAYRDFIPYSLSNPILTTPCGHNFKHDYKAISDAEAGYGDPAPADTNRAEEPAKAGEPFPALGRNVWRSERPYLVTLTDGALIPAYPVVGKLGEDGLRVGGSCKDTLWVVNDPYIEHTLIDDHGSVRTVSKDAVTQWFTLDDAVQALAGQTSDTTATKDDHEH